MIKKEIDGVVHYCFEPSEKESQLAFEKAMIGEETVSQLVKALLNAMQEAEISRRQAWESARQLLPEELRDNEEIEMTYNWILRGFTIKENK